MENLNIKLESISGNELIVRQGEALPLNQPKKIVIIGNIKSISAFANIRFRDNSASGLQEVDPKKALVIVDKQKLTITLLLDPENVFGTEITAKLEISDELKTFSINSANTFTREQLVKLIRFNKLYFDDAEKHTQLLSAYMAFNADVSAKTEQASDTRGNKANHFVKNVSTNVPTEFILNIPVFKGEPSQRFRVEICLDVTDGGSRFWFESVELHEMMQQQRDAIFDKELESCNGFVIINQ